MEVACAPLAFPNMKTTAAAEADWREIAPLLLRFLSLAQAVAPKADVTIPTADIHVLGMFWRSTRLFRGGLALIETDLPEEAGFLGRSLFEESLRLRELAERAERRHALTLGWANSSIDEKEGLVREGLALGLDANSAKTLAVLKTERANLLAYARRHGVGRLEKFMSVRAAAKKFGRNSHYWTYAWSHEAVHGSDAAWLFGRRRIAPDTVGLYAGTADRRLHIGIAAFLVSSLLDAVRATSSMFGWLPDPALEAIAKRVNEADDAE